jgi:glycosyltransferase involved in cell wall biosynthesis
LILLDDGSTDGTWRIIQAYEDFRIRRTRLGRVGRSNALNHGLHLSRGEYIAVMDADDESLPERLERQVAFLDSHPAVSILGTTYYRSDALRNERYVRCFPQTDQGIRRALALYIPICHGSVMYRNAVIDKIGGYNEDVDDGLEDLELWLRAARYFQFANLGPPPLHIYWFDPQHSYFQTLHGGFKRVWHTIRLNTRAIKQFQLPAYYYAMLGAKLLYYAVLPNRLKRLARNLVARGMELPWRAQFPGAELPSPSGDGQLGPL